MDKIKQGFQKGFIQGYTYKKIIFHLAPHIHPTWLRWLFLPLHAPHREAGDGPLLELENLVKICGTGAIGVLGLKRINLTMDRGKFVAITGYPGSGKSTLMNILGCLDRLTLGHYYLDGVDAAEMTPDKLSDIRNRKVGLVFQSFNLVSRTSILKSIELPMIYAKVPKAKRLQKVGILLERMGLGTRQDHISSELSGGQRQGVAIAKALANEPSLILADEPTGNLDTVSSIGIMELLSQLYQEGVTAMVVTHERGIAAFADRVIQLSDGQIQSGMLNVHEDDFHGMRACGSGKEAKNVD